MHGAQGSVRLLLFLITLHAQVRVDKPVQISVHDGIDISGFKSCSVVFYEFVRMKYVRTDLRTKIYIEIFTFELCKFFFMLSLSYFKKL